MFCVFVKRLKMDSNNLNVPGQRQWATKRAQREQRQTSMKSAVVAAADQAVLCVAVSPNF